MELVIRQWDAVDWTGVLCDFRIHDDRTSRSASSPQCACPFYSSHTGIFFGKTSHNPGLSAPLQPRFGSLRLLAIPKAKIAVDLEEICELDGHTAHQLSQRCLTANWLAPRESDCLRMHSRVFSDWLPSYIKATRPVLEIFNVPGYFPDSPRTNLRGITSQNTWIFVLQFGAIFLYIQRCCHEFRMEWRVTNLLISNVILGRFRATTFVVEKARVRSVCGWATQVAIRSLKLLKFATRTRQWVPCILLSSYKNIS